MLPVKSASRQVNVMHIKLMRDTRHLAQYCALDPAHDLGLGDVFVPELDVLLNRPVAEPEREANQILLRRCEDQLPQRYSHSQDRSVAFHRLEAEMRTITQLGFSGYFTYCRPCR